MNYLFRSLYLLFLPRLPRLGPEDVAGTAEYYNRLARHEEATINPPDVWIGRISTQPAMGAQPLKIVKDRPQEILRPAA
jgi:hypothetical protein